MADEATRACALEPADLFERVRQWRELARHALGRTVTEGKAVATYPRRDDLGRRLRELIEAEAACCPFLEFDLRERQDAFEVELRFPPEFAPMLEAILPAAGST